MLVVFYRETKTRKRYCLDTVHSSIVDAAFCHSKNVFSNAVDLPNVTPQPKNECFFHTGLKNDNKKRQLKTTSSLVPVPVLVPGSSISMSCLRLCTGTIIVS